MTDTEREAVETLASHAIRHLTVKMACHCEDAGHPEGRCANHRLEAAIQVFVPAFAWKRPIRVARREV